MLFNSLDYLLFLVLAVCGYWALLRLKTLRLALALAFSCLFYMAWSPTYIFLILGSTLLDYLIGLALGGLSAQSPAGPGAGRGRKAARKGLLLLSLCGNLGLLFTFKYFNFAGSVLQTLASSMGLTLSVPVLNVLLPVGISFYTFQTLSYTIDVYRGVLAPTRSLLKFACFVTFFPQLVAGPIVRASQFLPQLEKRPVLTVEQAGQGLFLIGLGLLKKVAVADYLSVNLVDRVFENPAGYTASEVIVGLYAFTLQIYCDFSGYTDVARGSAKLMGLELPENFDRPYQATSPADFWRRWHMTLSSWLRDYLYFPLGGSRSSPPRAYFNLWLTMFLIGIWHGASWTFVAYGGLQAFAMVAHRFVARARRPKSPEAVAPLGGAEAAPHSARKDSNAKYKELSIRVLKVAACLQFVVFSRLLFRATSMENAWEVAKRMFSSQYSLAQVSGGVWAVLLLGFAAHYTPKGWAKSILESFARAPALAQAALLLLLAVGLRAVATSEVVPYIYYQF